MTRLRRAAHLAAVAVQLLTRFPVRAGTVTDDDQRAAAAFHPLVGVLVAGVGIAVRAATGPAVGATPGTVLAVAAMVAATGAFHEDGLADTVDGLWGGWTPERRIEIMRDSRIGTYGTLALILAVGLRIVLLAPLDLGEFARVVIVGHVTGRAAGVAIAGTLPVIAAPGLGAKVIGPPGTVTAIAVAAMAAGASVAAATVWFWCPLLAAAVVVAAMRRAARLRLGGLTGDVLGATNQLGHIAAMAATVSLYRAGVA